MDLKQHSIPVPITILLAEDDVDDRFFFTKALAEIPIATNLTTVQDGELLMMYLSENAHKLPNVLFLDLSMPRKTGFECLSEIKENDKYKDLIVVMFSTSYTRDITYEQDMINMLYDIGAHLYIRKPSDFTKLKQVIQDVLIMVLEKKLPVSKTGSFD